MTGHSLWRAGRAAAILMLPAISLLAPAPARATHFARGQMQLGLALGGSGNFGTSYVVAGGGFGYFVLDGLELGASGQLWVGSPFIGTVSPWATYVLDFAPAVQPYVGILYRHWFIGDRWPDLDMLGGRGGIYIDMGPSAYLGLGVVYERAVTHCREDCEALYPEAALNLSF